MKFHKLLIGIPYDLVSEAMDFSNRERLEEWYARKALLGVSRGDGVNPQMTQTRADGEDRDEETHAVLEVFFYYRVASSAPDPNVTAGKFLGVPWRNAQVEIHSETTGWTKGWLE